MKKLEAEAEATRMLVETEGRKAFVLIASIAGDDMFLTRAISADTTRRDGRSWIAALNRERERIAKLIGIDPDSVEAV